MEREKAMSEGAYELLARAARYWFVLLIALIVARGWHACVTDNRRGKLLRGKNGDASCVGELLVIRDEDHGRLEGKRFPVPAEGMLGSARVADVRIKCRAVARRHLWLKYSDGYLTVRALGRADFSAPRTQDGRFILCDGDNLEIGPLTMTLVLYDAQEIAEPEEPQSPPPPAPKPRARRGENGVIEYDDEFWG